MPGSSIWLLPPARDPFNRTLQTQITSTVPMRFADIATAKPPNFLPHVTLTSHIPATLHEPDAQAWLDGLELDLPALVTRAEAAEKRDGEEDSSSAAAEKRALEAGDLPPAPQEPLAAVVAAHPEKAAALVDETTTTSRAQPVKLSEDVVVDLCALEADDPFFRKLTIKAAKPCAGLSALAAACRAQGCYGGDVETAKSWERDEYRPHLSLLYSEVSREEAQRKIPGVLQDLVRAKAILKPARDGTVAKGGTIVLVATDKEIDQWKPIASRTLDNVVWKWTST